MDTHLSGGRSVNDRWRQEGYESGDDGCELHTNSNSSRYETIGWLRDTMFKFLSSLHSLSSPLSDPPLRKLAVASVFIAQAPPTYRLLPGIQRHSITILLLSRSKWGIITLCVLAPYTNQASPQMLCVLFANVRSSSLSSLQHGISLAPLVI